MKEGAFLARLVSYQTANDLTKICLFIGGFDCSQFEISRDSKNAITKLMYQNTINTLNQIIVSIDELELGPPAFDHHVSRRHVKESSESQIVQCRGLRLAGIS